MATGSPVTPMPVLGTTQQPHQVGITIYDSQVPGASTSWLAVVITYVADPLARLKPAQYRLIVSTGGLLALMKDCCYHPKLL